MWRASTAEHDTLLFNLREDIGERYNLYRKYPGKAKEMLQKLQEYTRNFGEIPPGLVMTGNDASKYLRKQRQEAKEQAKAGGLKDKSTETDGFINVQ